MNSAVSEPALIGIDWGTSSLRAFLIGSEGEVLESVSSAEGILQVADRDFETVLARLVGRWMTGARLPVLASGMITSRNGWVETPYETLPLDAGDLARALVHHTTESGIRLSFVTGVTTQHEAGPDVMRGEETQIAGASALGMGDGIFVMPGTHSKWIRVEDGRIQDYATFITGEMYAALKEHTILGTLIEDGPYSETGFSKGVAAGLNIRSNLLHNLFHVRTLPLLGELEGTMVADYLSGMLIGTEIAAATSGESGKKVTIIGRNDLSDRYAAALSAAGHQSRRAPDDIVAKGHFLIARCAGLVV